MRIATLTINGFGDDSVRLTKLLGWMKDQKIDVMTLQKTFVSDEDFPERQFRRYGYRSESFGTRKSRWDFGVAILCREGLHEPKEIIRGLPCPGVNGSRFLALDIAGLYVSTVYAPYLSQLRKAEAIARRIRWLRQLRGHLSSRCEPGREVLACGDFNVKVDGLPKPNPGHYSEDERSEMLSWRKCGFVDLYRSAHGLEEKPGLTFGFSPARPEGNSRLHLAIASEGLGSRLVSASVDTDAGIRAEARPLMVEFS